MSDQTKLGTLLLVGVNHTTAPLDVRERLAIPVARLADATRSLAGQPGIREALILSGSLTGLSLTRKWNLLPDASVRYRQ